MILKLFYLLAGWKRFFKFRVLNYSYEADFLRWKKSNTAASFADYYVARELKGLQRQLPHPTLGSNLKRGKFSEVGKEGIFKLMIKNGLQAHHICVDYGCGSLRVGQHLIHYLEKGNYYGLDVTDVFFKMGQSMVDPAVWMEKQPHFDLINPESIAKVADLGADFVFSVGVLSHIPPTELDNYLKNILALVSKNTKLYLAITSYEQNIQLDELSWAYQKAFIANKIHEHKANLQIDFLQFKEIKIKTSFNQRKMERGLIRVRQKS